METEEKEIFIAKRRTMDEDDIIGFPWIFWLDIRIRKDWFSYWWKSRGSNCINFQVWIFDISIGRPWKKNALLSNVRDYNSLDSAKNTNNSNLKAPFAFQIGSYKNNYNE
jgi:hypothetical protein